MVKLGGVPLRWLEIGFGHELIARI